MIEPTNQNSLAERGLLVARVLVDKGVHSYPIRVFNPGTSVLTVGGGKCGGETHNHR